MTPPAKSRTGGVPVARPVGGAPPAPARLLVVEDNVHYASALRSNLEVEGLPHHHRAVIAVRTSTISNWFWSVLGTVGHFVAGRARRY